MPYYKPPANPLLMMSPADSATSMASPLGFIQAGAPSAARAIDYLFSPAEKLQQLGVIKKAVEAGKLSPTVWENVMKDMQPGEMNALVDHVRQGVQSFGKNWPSTLWPRGLK